MDCRRIRKLLDEAEQGRGIPFEAARHTQICESCRRFANERTRLAELLNSTGRVSAPPDFNMALMRRLRQRTAAQPARWYGHAFTLKLAGALAVLVCSVMLFQFWNHPTGSPPSTEELAAAKPTDRTQPPLTPPSIVTPPSAPVVPPVPPMVAPVHERSGGRHFNRGIGSDVAAALPVAGELRFPDDPRQDAAAFLWLKSGAVEHQVTVRAVSMGAQPVLLNSGPASDRVTF